MKKKGKYLAALGLILSVLLFPALPAEAAKTVYNSPYVTFSPDGRAWTTNAGDKNIQWYPYGETISTGIASSLRALETGEHYYYIPRKETVPVGYWRVEWTAAQCIHYDSSSPPEQFHDVSFTRNRCFKKYYSGWFAYCADCGERITDCFIYMSRDAAKSIEYLQLSVGGEEGGYYYLCPFCSNLEQGHHFEPHNCKAISINRYRVKYKRNFPINEQGSGGYMEDSIHMYNNSTEYEGATVTPVKNLSDNCYWRIGYTFTGWNTKPDGSGRAVSDGEEIWNLTTDNWTGEEDDMTGTVVLYAQWVKSESTLQIDPNGGSYAGNSGITSITQSYRTSYYVNPELLIPANGYRVTFQCNGGIAINDIVSLMHFSEWSMIPDFEGRFYPAQNKYWFFSLNAHTDTLRAIYAPDSIILPQPERPGYSFGGWYYDAAFQSPAGGAGDSITPANDLTLYAQWVELVLESQDNYFAYGGSGAVNLSWRQPDGQGKTYLLYQSRNPGMTDAKRINAVDDIGSTISARRDFGYTGYAEEYTVPYSGIYTLTLSGAQGSDYGTRTGGKGGSATLKVWLVKGEKLTVTVGGKDGYNGGGTGSMFGNGGGKTTVYSDRRGLLAVAGGGGAASQMGTGGAGGSEASLTAGGAGGSGAAGGGAGYYGGNAGELIVHSHSDDCYTSSSKTAGSRFYGTVSGGYTGYGHSKSLTHNDMKASIGFHTADEGGTCYLQVGDSSDYFRTPSAGTLTFHSSTYAWGDNIPSDQNVITTVYLVYSNGTVGTKTLDVTRNFAAKTPSSYEERWKYGHKCSPYSVYLFDLPSHFTGTLKTALSESWEEDGSYHGASAEYTFAGTYRFDIPEEVVGVYLSQDFTVSLDINGETGVWVSNEISNVTYSYSQVTCGRSEGEVISSKPAYGGSSYVNQTAVLSSVMTPGDRAGDGMVTLRSEAIGYTEEHEMKNVKATDLAAPYAIDAGSVEQQPAGTGQVTVTWHKPSDNGTDYYHQAETYLQGSTALLCRSNITKNTLVSGVKGYYYLVDTQPGSIAGAGAAFLQTAADTATLTIDVKEWVQYLHLATVDVAGNVSATTHIRIDAGSVRWKVYTRQLQIGSGENVFAAAEPETYFVRCDGSTPIHLTNSAYMDGQPTSEYQLNYTLYQTEIRGRADSSGENRIYTPSAADISADAEIRADRLRYAVSGATALKLYPYSLTRRSDRGRNLEAEQKFTLDRGMHGKYISVIPRAGAVYRKAGGEEIYYSDASTDATNGITLIGDCVGPVIVGLEGLENREAIIRTEETVTLTVTASDELSGVAEFYLKITNRDNFGERVFYPEDGVITLDITKAEPLFSGDFTVTAYAVDNVGNVTEISCDVTEFALEARIERILEPHDPVFKRGESGMLYVTTYGYADRVEVTFPAAMQELDERLRETIVFTYDGTDKEYRQGEEVQFMIPLYDLPDGDYQISVRAYKQTAVAEDRPVMKVTSEGGSVLDEFRTRLR